MINLRGSRGFNLSAGPWMISLCLMTLQRQTDPSDTSVIWGGCFQSVSSAVQLRIGGLFVSKTCKKKDKIKFNYCDKRHQDSPGFF